MAVGHKDFTQKKPLQLVYLELGVGNGGMLLTISEDGFRFRAVAPVHENTTMPFAFSLDGRNRLDGTGTVESVEEDGKSGGMRFTEVSPEFHAALGAWLNSDSSPHPGREVTPEAAPTPQDDMEKIRQELRSGYPARPAEVTKFPKQKPEPERKWEPEQEQESEPEQEPGPEPKIVARTASDKNISEQRNAGKSLAEKISPAKPKRPNFETPSEKISETRESLTAYRLFPLPSTSARESEKPAAVSSAFLKPPSEAKTSSKPAPAAATHSQSQTITRDGMVFSTTSTPRGAPSSAVESYAPAPTRPYIPPLEDSFEQAWEHGKLTSSTDSPHLGRAAAGGIIAIALAVILGALVYNFRQDIGAIFIQLGQSISGENRPAVPAPTQETKPETAAPDQQPQAQASQPTGSQAQNTPAESGNAANPPTGSADTNPTIGSANGDTPKTAAVPTGKSRNSGRSAVPPVIPPVENPQENSTAGAVDPAAKSGAAADSVAGQEEFTAARDILRGSNRQRELYKAVILLWASVKKGHVPAEVTLADLYRRGEGVEKNCDQARVLLVAASKKGSIEARQMLEQIAERGCQ
jgi:TPR repeat protein